MPRGTPTFNAAAAADVVSPVILVRVLNIPEFNSPSAVHSLYLCDAETDQSWYDEDGAAVTYTACALKYESVERSTKSSVNTCRLTIDNVDRSLSELARNYEINGVEVHVLRGFRDTLDSPDGAQYVFAGRIRECHFGQYNMEAVVTTGFTLAVKIPRRFYWPAEFPHIPSSKDPANVFTRG